MGTQSSLERFVTGKDVNNFGLHFIATPDTEKLAQQVREQIQSILNTARENGSTSAGNQEVTIEVLQKYDSFECGESITTLQESVRGKHVYVFSDPSGDYESADRKIRGFDLDKKFMHDLLLLANVKDNGASSINLVQACTPYARQDKTTPEKRQSASIDVIGNWISHLTQNNGYCITIDLHNPASKSAFQGTNFINLYTWWMVEEVIKKSPYARNDITLSGADQWGAKTIEAIAKALELSHIDVIKSRDYSIPNSVNEINIYGDISGKHVIIHDDMLDTGGTMKALIEKMITLHPKTIDVVITHGMLNGEAIPRLTSLKEAYPDVIGNIFITDSINKKDLPDFIRVISLKNILANTITGIYKWLGVNRGDNRDYTKK